ncbi:MAG: HD domain-containing protein [Thermomicrobiales bacterium]
MNWAPAPVPDPGTPASGSLPDLFAILLALKEMPRTGWVDRGIPEARAESVAEHSFQTALIAWMVALAHPERGLDADRVLKLALVHDLAESLIGDLPPYDPAEIPDEPDARRAFFAVRRTRTPEQAEAKRAAEAAATDRLLARMPPPVRTEIGALLHEYEARATPEARFVKEVDGLETFLQARAYATAFPEIPLAGFTDMAMHAIADPALTAIRDEAGGVVPDPE